MIFCVIFSIMNIIAEHSNLFGNIQVPGSKSHTIRALLLASLAEGTSHIKNPLPSADCLSTAHALPLLGAKVCGIENDKEWIVDGAGSSIHLPSDVVNVGDSGSLLYFLSPIASTFAGWSVFTGDESIRTRPVYHVVDALRQLGATAFTALPESKTCPLLIQGPVQNGTVKTAGEVSSQYISGLMMAALRLKGTMKIELSNPKETPYLTMTQKWLEKIGAKVTISDDFKHIEVSGKEKIDSFDCTIPSDWEGVAFPLIASLLTDSEIVIENVDSSGTQGDAALLDVLLSFGSDAEWNRASGTLTVRGGKKSKNKTGYLSTKNYPNGKAHINLSGYPDAVCALAAISCFVDGDIYIEDIAVCRRKETDRIALLTKELSKVGAKIEEGADFLHIQGVPPILEDGSKNPNFKMHGAKLESYGDHRLAMAFACLGLALPSGEKLEISNAECCSVSFPNFFDCMTSLGAKFSEK